MTNKQFLTIVAFVIVLLLGAILLEHYRLCQEKGGEYCWPGATMSIPSFAPR